MESGRNRIIVGAVLASIVLLAAYLRLHRSDLSWSRAGSELGAWSPSDLLRMIRRAYFSFPEMSAQVPVGYRESTLGRIFTVVHWAEAALLLPPSVPRRMLPCPLSGRSSRAISVSICGRAGTWWPFGSPGAAPRSIWMSMSLESRARDPGRRPPRRALRDRRRSVIAVHLP